MRENKCFKKVGWFVVAGVICVSGCVVSRPTVAVDCPNVRVVFARGSGGERWKDQNYLAYKSSIESKLMVSGLSYEFIDLDYPAI